MRKSKPKKTRKDNYQTLTKGGKPG